MSLYYEDEYVQLHHGSAEDVMADWLSEHATPNFGKVIVTSPPYNMGVTPGGNGRGIYRTSKTSKGSRFHAGYEDHADAMPQDKYDDWQRECLRLMWDLIPDDGAIFYNHKQRVEHGIARLPLGLDFGIPLRQIITWDRGTGIGVNKRHFASVSEFIFLFAKPNFELVDHSQSGRGDIWRLGMAREGFDHPAPFPESLPATVLEATGAPSVLDPFAGSGTTLRVASERGVRAVGIEKSERYCEMIVKRLSQQAFDFSQLTDDAPCPR